MPQWVPEITPEKIDIFISEYRKNLEAEMPDVAAKIKAFMLVEGGKERPAFSKEQLVAGLTAYAKVFTELGVTNPLLDVVLGRHFKKFLASFFDVLTAADVTLSGFERPETPAALSKGLRELFDATFYALLRDEQFQTFTQMLAYVGATSGGTPDET